MTLFGLMGPDIALLNQVITGGNLSILKGKVTDHIHYLVRAN